MILEFVWPFRDGNESFVLVELLNCETVDCATDQKVWVKVTMIISSVVGITKRLNSNSSGDGILIIRIYDSLDAPNRFSYFERFKYKLNGRIRFCFIKTKMIIKCIYLHDKKKEERFNPQCSFHARSKHNVNVFLGAVGAFACVVSIGIRVKLC